MEYTVKPYNDFYIDVYIGEFNVLRFDREWPSNKPETARQAHARIREKMNSLNGVWLIGEYRSRIYPENNLRRSFNVTITPDQECDDFIPSKKLIVKNGVVEITLL